VGNDGKIVAIDIHQKRIISIVRRDR
jgi:hypothetical protein